MLSSLSNRHRHGLSLQQYHGQVDMFKMKRCLVSCCVNQWDYSLELTRPAPDLQFTNPSSSRVIRSSGSRKVINTRGMVFELFLMLRCLVARRRYTYFLTTGKEIWKSANPTAFPRRELTIKWMNVNYACVNNIGRNKSRVARGIYQFLFSK